MLKMKLSLFTAVAMLMSVGCSQSDPPPAAGSSGGARGEAESAGAGGNPPASDDVGRNDAVPPAFDDFYTSPYFVEIGVGLQDGWTQFERDGHRIIYVSSSQGDPANDGLSPESPLDDPATALDMLEPGDWLLFRRGDEFTTLPSVTVSGPDPEHPTVVGAYGEEGEPRPVFSSWPGTHGGQAARLDNIAWVSLRISGAANDPDSPAFVGESVGPSFNLPASNLLIEDCKLEFGQLNFKGWDEAPMVNIQIRRSVFAFSWDDGGHAQGVYTSRVNGLLIEESVFDHSGHHPHADYGTPTKFNHSLYVQENCDQPILRNSITARASSHGFQLRPNGVAEGNLSVGNVLAGFIAGDNWNDDAVQILRGNVAMHGRSEPSFGPSAAGFQMWGGVDGAIFEDNLVAHTESGRVPLGYPEDYATSTEGNIIYQWGDESDAGDFPDPSRDVGSYNASLGGEDSLEAFLDEAREQRKGDWDSSYTAWGAIAYLRAGFSE